MYYKDHMDYEPPQEEDDPIYEEARYSTDAELEGIKDDLDDNAYNKLWQETYHKTLERLRAERAAEIERYNAITPEERRAFDESRG